MDENETRDGQTSADDNGQHAPQMQPQPVAVVVAEPVREEGEIRVRYRLQFMPGAIQDPVGFCCMLAQLAAGNAGQFYERQKSQIAVPRIQIPGGANLRGGSDGPAMPPIQFRGRRGKGRG